MVNIKTLFLEGEPELQIEEYAYVISRLRGEPEDKPEYLDEIRPLVEADNIDELYAKLVKDGKILLQVPDREYESCYNLLFAILCREESDKTEGYLKQICKDIVEDAGEKYIAKQRVLTNLYNILSTDSPLRHDVFVHILNLAAKHDEFDTIQAQLPHVDGWMSEWKINMNQRRDLYILISEKAKEAQEETLAYQYLVKALSTYQNPSEIDTNATELAKKAIILSVKTPSFYSFEELLQLAAVQSLKDTKEYALLNVFLNDNLQAYKTFASSNSAFLEQAGLSDEDNITKMRLLTLASLGSENLSRDLSYKMISEALEIPEEDVEMWVIDVIRAGLAEAKLNQLTKTVTIHKSQYRVFGPDQWKQLSQKLNNWKQSLSEILTVVGKARDMAREQQPMNVKAGTKSESVEITA
ncbi:hypothetical protein BZG36_02660 [Bifiguratus adelaidae]|uniref:Eukaryotic translation initiation factor 3 subunit M n=1 Tax=Bifiguratus adelaidae TaxID=1938954 RepID=A0A261Y2U3_9FUNG|nr:hypothetical protein BZG36_02660 [Bifiguratus adelaidae]